MTLLALVFGTLVIVVSIAAENTPKLIDLFIGDPLGRFYIWLIMLSTLENIYLQPFSTHPSIFLSNLVFLNCYVLLPSAVLLAIPYTYYILRYTKNANVINQIFDENLNLHHEWDDIPTDIGEAATKELLDDANASPASQGGLEGWPATWASDTILVSQQAFSGLKFNFVTPTPPSTRSKWTVSFDDHMAYLRSMDAIKRKQLAKGGARLAEILNAIWP